MTHQRYLPTELTAFGIGLVAAWASLALGLFCGEPLIRELLGPPRGFGEDYTTWQGSPEQSLHRPCS